MGEWSAKGGWGYVERAAKVEVSEVPGVGGGRWGEQQGLGRLIEKRWEGKRWAAD